MDYKIEEKVVQMLKSGDEELHNLAIEMYFSQEPGIIDFTRLRNMVDPSLNLLVPNQPHMKHSLTQKSLIKIKDRIWGQW